LEKIEMKKTLVAVAAMAAVTGAMAEVKISGNLNQSYTTTKVTGGLTTIDADAAALGDQSGDTYDLAGNGVQSRKSSGLLDASAGSFIVFSGNEDLGSGMKATFKVDMGLNLNGSALTSGATTGDNREAWIGLNGGFGIVQIGRQYSPLFLNAAAQDPNGVNNVGGWTPLNVMGGNGLVSNASAINWALPTFVPGVSVAAQLATGGGNTTAGGASKNATGLSLSYANGGLYAGYATDSRSVAAATEALITSITTSTVDLEDAVTDTGTAVRVLSAATGGLALMGSVDTGGAVRLGSLSANSYSPTGGEKQKSNSTTLTYDFGMAKVGYTNVTAKLATDKVTSTSYAISAPLTANLTVAYTSNSGKGSVATTGEIVKLKGTQMGAYYALSKRSQLYFLNNSLEADILSGAAIIKSTSSSFGINHSF
jgi:predicted porin